MYNQQKPNKCWSLNELVALRALRAGREERPKRKEERRGIFL
jgi:hypothetical protein